MKDRDSRQTESSNETNEEDVAEAAFSPQCREIIKGTARQLLQASRESQTWMTIRIFMESASLT